MSTERSYIVKQTCSWKLHVCLSMYDLSVNSGTKRLSVVCTCNSLKSIGTLKMQFTKNWCFFAGIDPRLVAYVEPNFSELLRKQLTAKRRFRKRTPLQTWFKYPLAGGVQISSGFFLGPYRTSIMWLFCKNISQLKAVIYIHKKLRNRCLTGF